MTKLRMTRQQVLLMAGGALLGFGAGHIGPLLALIIAMPFGWEVSMPPWWDLAFWSVAGVVGGTWMVLRAVKGNLPGWFMAYCRVAGKKSGWPEDEDGKD